MRLFARFDDGRLRKGTSEARERIVSEIEIALARGAEEVARLARQYSPAVFSNLVNSIRAERVGELHYRVSPGVNYARQVEEGTKPGYVPNLLNLRMYVQASLTRQRGFRWGKPGAAKRRRQEDEIADRTKALAFYIRAHGTKAHPYMRPAFVESESRVVQLIREAGMRGAQEAFNG